MPTPNEDPKTQQKILPPKCKRPTVYYVAEIKRWSATDNYALVVDPDPDEVNEHKKLIIIRHVIIPTPAIGTREKLMLGKWLIFNPDNIKRKTAVGNRKARHEVTTAYMFDDLPSEEAMKERNITFKFLDGEPTTSTPPRPKKQTLPGKHSARK